MTPKDNFAQTMKDLLGGTDKPENSEEKGNLGVPLSSFGQPQRDEKDAEPAASGAKSPIELPTPEDRAEAQAKPVPVMPETDRQDEQPLGFDASASSSQGGQAAPVYNSYSPDSQATSSSSYGAGMPQYTNNAEETTVIAAGTKIVGDVDTDGSLRIHGSVKGNIRVGGKLNLASQLIGDIEAQDIEVESSVVKGNVSARNFVKIDNETTIVGDVSAKNAEVNGKIKGNLTVQERAHIKKDSILMGNLMSGTVNIEEGAMLKGDISITNIQSENVVIVEPEFDISIAKKATPKMTGIVKDK